MNDQPHLDHEALAELRDVMEDEFDILISTFLEDSVDRVEQLRSAAEQQDAAAFTKAAHSFKGSCINIGAPVLAEKCQEAERHGRDGDLKASDRQITAIQSELALVSDELRSYLNH